MSATDFLNLNDREIFNVLRETLPNNFKKAHNLLTINDDYLFTWNFQDNCVLALNIKNVYDKSNDTYQTLLPTSPPLFKPELMLVNDFTTLLVVAGLFGVLVFELPGKNPARGTFENGKKVIYCRSFSLHERLLAFNSGIEVRQVRFHPGSPNGTHILILTSDNAFRLCKIENSEAIAVGVFPIGLCPRGKFPETKRFYMEEMGDTAVDFDFSTPELYSDSNEIFSKSFTKSKTSASKLNWPIYFLHGNGLVFMTNLAVDQKIQPEVMGPLHIYPSPSCIFGKDYCAILCIPSTPTILCVAHCNGTISHSLVLPVDPIKKEKDSNNSFHCDSADRAMYTFETVEIELGLTTTETDHKDYCCPIFLHKDNANIGNYYATHETGAHSISINIIDDLHSFVLDNNDQDNLIDLFKVNSSAEYLLCTKTTASSASNPVIGFSICYDPLSVVILLANGRIISLAIVSLPLLPSSEDLEVRNLEAMETPLKKMLSNPFDVIIQKILKNINSQPILMLSSTNANYNQQECYELLFKAVNAFKQKHLKYLTLASEEIEKRVKALKMLKEYQTGEIEQMNVKKQELQEKAESLAEKYEDIKDKQDEMMKRCEKILLLISRNQSVPSNAEKKMLAELKLMKEKLDKYRKNINNLQNKHKYQEIQMENWKSQNVKETIFDGVQTERIKASLEDMTSKIAQMVKEINEYKSQLNI